MCQVLEVQDGEARVQVPKLTDKLLAAETRHVAVGHHQIVGQLSVPGSDQACFPIRDRHHVVPRHPERAHQEIPDSGLVIHNQDAGRRRGHSSHDEVSRCRECTRQFGTPLVGRLTSSGEVLA